MTYMVKESFLTIQGEGRHAGRVAVFCRFSGCNLWSGRDADRSSAVCRFCDTDFVGTDGDGGGKFSSADELAQHVRRMWPITAVGAPYVVCTGGEPLLQLDQALVDAFHACGLEVAVETNGTQDPPTGLDWVCVSPKATAPLKLRRGNELKLVFPQSDVLPEHCVELDFEHFYLQPMDGPKVAENTRLAVEFCLRNPKWKLSLQTHKMIGVR